MEDALRGVSKNAVDEQVTETQTKDDPAVHDVLDAFGSLTIGEKGQVTYHGVSSMTEVSPPHISPVRPSDLIFPAKLLLRSILPVSKFNLGLDCVSHMK